MDVSAYHSHFCCPCLVRSRTVQDRSACLLTCTMLIILLMRARFSSSKKQSHERLSFVSAPYLSLLNWILKKMCRNDLGQTGMVWSGKFSVWAPLRGRAFLRFLGWGGGGAITFMSLACKVMRRGCCADVTLIIRWCYVEEMLMLLLGWGGVGWGWGVAITFMSLACKVMRRGCCADVTLIIRWCYVEETLMLLLGWGGVGGVQ